MYVEIQKTYQTMGFEEVTSRSDPVLPVLQWCKICSVNGQSRYENQSN